MTRTEFLVRSTDLAVAAAGVALVFVVLVVVVLVLVLRGGTRPDRAGGNRLADQRARIAAGGPPTPGPQLNSSARRCVWRWFVLAPAGRRAGDDAPPMLGQLLDSLVPGLAPSRWAIGPLIRWGPLS